MSQTPHAEARQRRRRDHPWPQTSSGNGSNEYTLPLRSLSQDQQYNSPAPTNSQAIQGGLNDVDQSYYPASGNFGQQHTNSTDAGNLEFGLSSEPSQQSATYFGSQEHPHISGTAEPWIQYPSLDYDESTDVLPVQESYMADVQQLEHSSLYHETSVGPSAYPDASHDSDPQMESRTPGDPGPERRLCCPFTIKDPHLLPVSAACWSTGFQNVSRLKQHLRRNHRIEISQQERNTTEEEKFENVWRELYPEYTGQIPSPYGWNKEALQRRQNLRVIEEHEEFIRAQVWQRFHDAQMVSMLDGVFDAFRHSRRVDLLPRQE